MTERMDSKSRVCVSSVHPVTNQQIPMASTIHHSPTLDGLPKQFVAALRTLFDILDEKGIGFVKFSDIENRWEDDGTKGIPKGVVESLHKVTPPNGLLSFERFCAGLKICLLRNQIEKKKQSLVSIDGARNEEAVEPGARPPSAPLLDVRPKQPWSTRQASMSQQQRAFSMPQLPPAAEPAIGIPVKSPLYGPPKPPRSAVGLERSIDKSEIRSALQNWQLGLMLEEEKRGNRPLGIEEGTSPPLETQKKPPGRKREPRRHTLQNGIDYNMLKRMKQIELEKDILMQGLEAVDRARDWYLKQIAVIQEKMNNLGRSGLTDQWSVAQGERVELQRARILEVNRHLATLTDPGLPLHMNLAVNPHSSNVIARLRQQNHLLTQEVSKKKERITALEHEKSSLLRELFISRSQGRPREPSEESGPFM